MSSLHTRIIAIAGSFIIVLAVGLSTLVPRAARSAQQTPAQGVAAPELIGDQWINISKGTLDTVKSFKGHVTVLHFWTFECINCKHNLPYYAKWAAAYKPTAVQLIGVHTPELEVEKDPANVREAVKALGINYPVLIDGDGENWNRYHQEVWPTVYVVDKKGNVRYHWTGELQWDGQDGFGQVSAVIEKLRKE